MLFVPAAEFANGAAQSGLLTLEETNEIFLYYTAQKKPSLNFPVVKRKGLMPQCCHRFQSSAYRSNQWRYRYIIIPRASHLEVHWSFIDTLFVVYCSGDAAMPFSLLLTSEFSLLALVCMDHRMVLQNTWLVFYLFLVQICGFISNWIFEYFWSTVTCCSGTNWTEKKRYYRGWEGNKLQIWR